MEKRYRLRTKNVFFILLLTVAIAVIACLSFLTDDPQRDNRLVYLTFFVNGILWFGLLLREVKRYAFSFRMMHWAFCLMFFFFAATAQYLTDSFPWVGKREDEILLRTNLILLLWTAAVCLGRVLHGMGRKRIWSAVSISEWHGVRKWLPALTIISVLNLLYRIDSIGVMNLLSRSTSTIQYAESSSAALLIGKVMQSFAYFAAVISIIQYKKQRTGLIWVTVNTVCLVISYFPTGVARYVAAMVYMGLLLTCSRRIKTGRMFVLLFLGAFLVGLPFLNFFRNLAFSEVVIGEALHSAVSDVSGMWLSGDYDAYTMMSLMVEYVDRYSPTWGRQFIGVLLFWVPRALWPQKPVGSGYFVSEKFGLTFNNVCCPLPGEGMINFGVVGVLLFGIFVGWLMTWLDDLYWTSIDYSGMKLRCIDVIYPAACILFFFMSRGDLLSSFAYMMSLILVWYMMVIVSRVRIGRGYVRFLRGVL